METSPSDLLQLIAAEFDRRHWDYDLAIGRNLVEAIEQVGNVDGRVLAQRMPSDFFNRNDTTRSIVAAAIERAVGGRVPKRGTKAATLVFADNRRYALSLSDGSRIVNSSVNIGEGVSINLSVDPTKGALLEAVEAILRAGLVGDWNDDAARELASMIDARDDIDFDDVREITADVVQAEQPRRERVRGLLTQIATGGLGGALGTGISVGLGELMGHLPL